MARITEEEKREFHVLLDESISKLGTDKNINKKHWSSLSLEQLNKLLMIESHELDFAVMHGTTEDINSECDDIINYALFIKHNLSKTNGKKY